jgi:DNA-binding IclR family transcriptional regulator
LPISGPDIWHARLATRSPGINAFAAPVFDHEGAVVLSVTAMGPERSFDARWTSAIAKALLDCTNDISRRLGFSASARK